MASDIPSTSRTVGHFDEDDYVDIPMDTVGIPRTRSSSDDGIQAIEEPHPSVLPPLLQLIPPLPWEDFNLFDSFGFHEPHSPGHPEPHSPGHPEAHSPGHPDPVEHLPLVDWRRHLEVIAGLVVLLIIVTCLSLALFFVLRKKNIDDNECKTTFTVSKDGNSDFKTISEAVAASPVHPYKTCIHIRAGEYYERVKIDQSNLVLKGEGSEKTIISSNASLFEVDDSWRTAATLWVIGREFVARDLRITTTVDYGVAVNNWGERSVFFRCVLEGSNSTLHAKKHNQFYRSSQIYGGNYLVYGNATAFFQKCDFIHKKSYPAKQVVFLGQSSVSLTFRFGFIVHNSAFYSSTEDSVTSSKPAFLGGAIGDYASIVVMQSYLDASVVGYFIDPNSTSFFAIYSNNGPGASKENLPTYVNALENVKAQSEYSLRTFVGEQNWIPSDVEYDLDLN